jgi:hypothetical protein
LLLLLLDLLLLLQCALHPDMRTAWAQGWARLLSPGGELVTMVYPVDSSRDPNTGPPWPVTPELYKQLLPPAGTLLTLYAFLVARPAMSHARYANLRRAVHETYVCF